MKVIILGANGQIGRVIHQELKEFSNMEVMGTSRNAAFGLLKFDPFNDNWSLLGKSDVLINCIGQIAESKDFSFKKIHIELTKLIIKNKNIIGNPRFIQISALGASPHHEVEFLRTKGIADELLLKLANTVVVRPSIVCTPQTMLVKKIQVLLKVSRFTGGHLFLPKGFAKHKIQPVMPRDLAGIVKNLCEADKLPLILNVPGKEPIEFCQLIALMFKAHNKKYKTIEVPKGVMDILVKYLFDPLLPNLINDQQYRLLFTDNIADKSEAEYYLGKPLSEPVYF